MNWRQLSNRIIVTIGILAIIPILLISRYNYPSADDYNFSESYTWEIAHNGGSPIKLLEGAMKTVKLFYEGWQGTYAASFFASLHPGIYGNSERLYAITALIIIMNTLLSMFLFLKELCMYLQMNWKKCRIITIPIFLAIIEGMPSPVQGLFWYTGCMTYMYFWTIMIAMTALLLNNLRSDKVKVWKILVGMFLGFLAVGGNHVTAFASVLVSLGFVIYSLIKKQWKKLAISGPVCCMAIFGFVLMAVSPGTSARASVLEKQSVVKTIVLSALVGVEEWQNHFKLPVLALLVLIVVFVSGHMIHEKNREMFKFRYLLGMIVLFYGLYCAMLCVPYYPMGFFGEGRVEDVRHATYIAMLSVMTIYSCGCIEVWIERNETLVRGGAEFRNIMGAKKIAIVSLVLICMVSISMFSGGIGNNVSYQCTRQLLKGEAKQYGQECRENYGHDVPHPTVKPSMIFYTSLEQED